MNHHSIADINADMRSSGRIVGSLEENQITRFRFRRRDNVTEIFESVSSLSADAPAIAAIIDDPTHKARTVKTGGWGRTAPNIRIAQILFCFPYHIGKCGIGQSLPRNIIIRIFSATTRCRRNVIAKQVGAISQRFQQQLISFHLIFG